MTRNNYELGSPPTKIYTIMANNKQKLELTWIGKNNTEYNIANIEPRILEERTDLSYGDPASENMIIHGDNLLALKALLPEYEGTIKCIYIDPPYNTGSAFEHYDDSVEHSTWLSLIKPRLELLRILLREDGSIWISIDDNEAHYLKMLCDEIFGRQNFIASIIWEKTYSERMDSKGFSSSHDYILVYRKSDKFQVNQLATPQNEKQFNFYDEKVQKYYRRRSLRKEGSESLRADRPSMWYEIEAPNGDLIYPYKPNGIEGRWRWRKENVKENSDLLEFIQRDDGWEIYVKQYLDKGATRPPATLWRQEEVGHNHEAKEEVKAFNNTNVFDTPKPERLIQRILKIGSNEQDWVLDSFLGSGTTASVAHKMGRKYIGIEMGDHAYTHCKVRLDKVIDGTDHGGINKVVDWKGGGGFKFYELAPSFVVIDEFGNPVIDSYYNDTKLIRAMCKLTNYTFAPNPTNYWKQGKGQGSNSIYVTTQMLSVAMVQQIVSHLDSNETLLICPKKYEPGCEKVDSRITIKKIPQSILKSCQFGKKEYLLPVKERTLEEIEEEELTDEQD